MSNIIGEGRFPASLEVVNIDMTGEELPEKVIPIPTELNMQKSYDEEVAEFNEVIKDLIETIIRNGILDYLDSIKKRSDPKIIRKYQNETDEIYYEMFKKATTIEDTLENLEDYGFEGEFSTDLAITLITDMLSGYRDTIFDFLTNKSKKEEK